VRPDNLVPHESARAHVTGEALYTDDLLPPGSPSLLHAWPVLAPHPHALVKACGCVGGVCPSLVFVNSRFPPPTFRAKATAAPRGMTNRCFLKEVDVSPAAGGLGAWVRRLEAAQPRRRAGRWSSMKSGFRDSDHSRRHRKPQFLGSAPARLARGDVLPVIEAQPTGILGRAVRSAARSTSISKPSARIAWITETGGVALHSSTQHPSETQEIVARVLGDAAQPGDRRMSGAWAARSAAKKCKQIPGLQSPRSARGKRGGPCGCG
jgi:xanthine dehydrogenase large subunit